MKIMLLKEDKNYEKLLEDKEWIAEFKRDGNFLLVKYWKDSDNTPVVEFYNRKGKIYVKDIPKEVLISFNKFADDEYAQSFIIVGELVYVDKDGRDHRTQAQSKNAIPYFMAFDILSLNNEDLTDRKWIERKHELTQLFIIYDMQPSKGEHVIIVPHYIDKKAVLEMAKKLKLEGIVLKKIDGKYVEGRSKDNIKVKFKETDEYIVIGYVDADEFTIKKDGTKSLNARHSYFGALILAKYKKENSLVPMGRVGGGFTTNDLVEVTQLLNKPMSLNIINTTGLTDKDYRYSKGKINWLNPQEYFVIEISMSGKTEYNRPFQPTFISVRDDKTIKSCVKED